MTYLVTGGAGFIGSQRCNSLVGAHLFFGDIVGRDAVRAVTQFTTLEVVNVCSVQQTTISQLSRTSSSIAGVLPRVLNGPSRRGDIQTSPGDPAKAMRRLGFRTEGEIGEGLRKTSKFLKTMRTEESHAI